MIVVTGPECSGKTTLAGKLARALKLPLIDEASRAYLEAPQYLPSDLLQMYRLQQNAELLHQQNPFVADTDLQVIYIWWQEKFGPAPEVLSTAYASLAPRHYLLCRPDLPWVSDPLRENPHDRSRLFDLYQADLTARRLPFSIIEGNGEARLTCALEALSRAGVPRPSC